MYENVQRFINGDRHDISIMMQTHLDVSVS